MDLCAKAGGRVGVVARGREGECVEAIEGECVEAIDGEGEARGGRACGLVISSVFTKNHRSRLPMLCS